MKLKISKNQKKGMMGSPTFELFCKLECTPEELAVIKEYKLTKEPIFEKRNFEGSGAIGAIAKGLGNKKMTVGSMCNGEMFSCKSIGEMQETESHLIAMCKLTSDTVKECANFGGETLIDL